MDGKSKCGSAIEHQIIDSINKKYRYSNKGSKWGAICPVFPLQTKISTYLILLVSEGLGRS